MYIIATVGPSTKEKRVIKEIVKAGANVLRLNFSHGSYEEFSKIIKIAKEADENIHILQDLSGRKIRVSYKLKNVLKIYDRENVLFCGEDIYKKEEQNGAFNSKKIIPLNLCNEILIKNTIKEITMKDNTMKFKILSIDSSGVLAEAIKGGVVRAEKGCNIKGFKRDELELSTKDKIDLQWAAENKIDIVSVSFVEKKDDIYNIKRYLDNKNFKPIIWAKIETPKGIENIKEILEEVDGIIIGRGDLIPESSITYVPIYQDMIIKASKGKDIIIATHILNSMRDGMEAKLSEVESIFNHLKNGVNGFLLAGETSIGKVPISTVEFLRNLISEYRSMKVF